MGDKNRHVKKLYLIAVLAFSACNSQKDGIAESTIDSIVDGSYSTVEKPIVTEPVKVKPYQDFEKEITEISVAESPDKCNLWKGHYKLKHKIVDSMLIYEMALAIVNNQHQGYREGRREDDCPYKRMEQIFIYMNEEDFKTDDAIAVAVITPMEPKGQAFVKYHFIEKYLKNARQKH